MDSRMIHTITEEDVGKGTVLKQCVCCGSKTNIYLTGVIGRVQPRDVGKRVYKESDGVITVESERSPAR